MNTHTTRNILYCLFILYILSIIFALFRVPLSIGWDPGICIKMADNWIKGIPFNYYSHPNPANLSADELEFVTWWTPGQFAVPLLFKNIFGVNMNNAIRTMTALCLGISGWGIFKLYALLLKDRFINNHSIIIISLVLFTVLQPFFWGNLFNYDGGGILLLAYSPWFIYGVIRVKRINILTVIGLLLSGFFGFFLKSSFTATFAGALGYLFLISSINPDVSIKKQHLKKIFVNGAILGTILIAYMLAIKLAFLSHNRSISDSSMGIAVQPRALLFPVIAPVIGVFAMNYLNKTAYWLTAFIIVLPIYYFMFKKAQLSLTYKYVMISFVFISVLFYVFLYFIRVDVSYELRHYTIMVIVCSPALFITLWKLPFRRYLVFAIVVVYTLTNIYNYSLRFARALSAPKSNLYSGFMSNYPANLINKIHSLDSANTNGRDIFYLKSNDPYLAYEIKTNRVLLADNYINFHFNNEGRFKPILYYGKNNGQLYVVSPQGQSAQDSTSFFGKFEKYRRFKNIYQTKGYIIYKALLTDSE